MFWYRFTLTEAVICLPHETRTHTDTHAVWVTDYSLTEAYKNTSLSSHPASWHTVSHHKSPCQNHRKASSCLIAWKSVCVFGACWCFNYITADITAVSVQPVLFVWKTVTALKLNAGFGPPVRGSCPPTPWMLILKKTSVRVTVTVCGLIFFYALWTYRQSFCMRGMAYHFRKKWGPLNLTTKAWLGWRWVTG